MQKALFMRQIRFAVALAASPIGLIGSSILLATTPIAPLAAQSASLSRWQYDPTTQQLEVIVPAGTTPRYFLAAEPARIVLDLPGTEVGAVQQEQAYSGAVQQIRVAQFQPGLARIVMQLAPETELAPQQAELKRVGTATVNGQTGDRWVLRPLMATATPTASTAPTPDPTPLVSTANSADTANSDDPAAAGLPPLEPGATAIPVEMPPADPVANPVAETAASPDATSAPLPQATASVPDMPAAPAATPPTPSPEPATNSATNSATNQENPAIDPPVAEATPAAPTAQPSPSPQDPTPAPLPQATASVPDMPAPAATSPRPNPEPATNSATNQENLAIDPPVAEATPTAPIAQPSPSSQDLRQDLAMVLPPAEDQPDAAATVTVPELPDAAAPIAAPSTAAPNPAPALPPATATAAPSTERVTVPDLSTSTAATPSGTTSIAPIPSQAAAVQSIEFGQPLPTTPDATVAVRPTSPGVLLPLGTVLSLRYPGSTELKLSSNYPYQDVLVVDQAVRDQAGQVVIPAGSSVIGRFETGSQGSEFIAQAIEIQGQTVLLNAKSDRLSGDRQVSRNHLLQNSALGAIAGTLLGAFTGVGLIAGIAAGAATSAATTYITSPQPAVIQPDQIVEVRLLEDLHQPNLRTGIGG